MSVTIEAVVCDCSQTFRKLDCRQLCVVCKDIDSKVCPCQRAWQLPFVYICAVLEDIAIVQACQASTSEVLNSSQAGAVVERITP